ncbi:hypothetical protein Bbelb_381620 [Branchiostoma belcheri]|nr:hypothetical protein Bbelb_381620 [Branchiostoma belcheri]
MGSLGIIKHLVRPGDFIAKLDLKDASRSKPEHCSKFIIDRDTDQPRIICKNYSTMENNDWDYNNPSQDTIRVVTDDQVADKPFYADELVVRHPVKGEMPMPCATLVTTDHTKNLRAPEKNQITNIWRLISDVDNKLQECWAHISKLEDDVECRVAADFEEPEQVDYLAKQEKSGFQLSLEQKTKPSEEMKTLEDIVSIGIREGHITDIPESFFTETFEEEKYSDPRRAKQDYGFKEMEQKDLQELIPGLAKWRIDQAKAHAAEAGPGKPVQQQIYRTRLNPVKTDHFLAFLTEPHFQDVTYGTKTKKLDSVQSEAPAGWADSAKQNLKSGKRYLKASVTTRRACFLSGGRPREYVTRTVAQGVRTWSARHAWPSAVACIVRCASAFLGILETSWQSPVKSSLYTVEIRCVARALHVRSTWYGARVFCVVIEQVNWEVRRFRTEVVLTTHGCRAIAHVFARRQHAEARTASCDRRFRQTSRLIKIGDRCWYHCTTDALSEKVVRRSEQSFASYGQTHSCRPGLRTGLHQVVIAGIPESPGDQSTDDAVLAVANTKLKCDPPINMQDIDRSLPSVVPLAKTSPPSITELRPVSLTSILAKVCESFVSEQILADIAPNIDDKQFGGLPGRSTTLCLVDIMHLLYKNSDHTGTVSSLVLTDFSKAFDRVDHTVAITRLLDLGCRPSLIPWLCDFLTSRRQRVLYQGSLSGWEVLTCGLPQGTVLAPIVFIATINSAALNATSHQWKFVDDLNMIETRHIRAKSSLQHDLNELDKWTNESFMKLHPNKCKVVHFHFTKIPPPLPALQIDGHTLQSVNSAKLLGVWIQSDLKWNTHVTHMIKQGSKRLFLLRRLKQFSLPIDDMVVVYTTYIRPVLEYAAPVWSPGLTERQSQLESVQKGRSESSSGTCTPTTRKSVLSLDSNHLQQDGNTCASSSEGNCSPTTNSVACFHRPEGR